MIRKTYTPEQIIGKLREAEVHLSQGLDVGEASRKIGVTEQTYYRWRKEYDGMRVEQAKRLKDLDGKNARLKHLVADLSLMLKLDTIVRIVQIAALCGHSVQAPFRVW